MSWLRDRHRRARERRDCFHHDHRPDGGSWIASLGDVGHGRKWYRCRRCLRSWVIGP